MALQLTVFLFDMPSWNTASYGCEIAIFNLHCIIIVAKLVARFVSK
jgi:hypothetical protein